MENLFERLKSQITDRPENELKYIEKSGNELSKTLTSIVGTRYFTGVYIGFHFNQYLEIFILPNLNLIENFEIDAPAMLLSQSDHCGLETARFFIFTGHPETRQLVGRDILNEDSTLNHFYTEQQLIDIVTNELGTK
ncbi:hypothetical protein [Dyadobacter psychrotolerans]|uniref:Uncharacterized protein n=1 Tax=Dyadobacter psychrotolerans TaxID=2541721 RepID=A0A4R5D7V2_9BACT|nr:hypothetical protein [Dyadobacter psychrotolerans]TDE09609.1 hypothetical protein E0F88_30445 [Dyadobacter psychrotolerans]